MELACIVSEINGCNEIIKHNKNGIIISVKNVAALVDSMSFVYLNKRVSKNMGINSRGEYCL